jgi:hypothetical protein
MPHLNGVGATLVAFKTPLRGTLPIAPCFSEELRAVGVVYLAIEMKLEYLDSFPSLMMNILDSTLGR